MHPSRATLATTGILLSLLLACSEQAVVPTEPSRAATMPSIPGSSSAVVRTGPEAERFLEEKAAEWSRRGDLALSRYLESQRALSVSSDRPIASRRIDAPPARPSLVIIDGGDSQDPSPSTRPDAYIYFSSTAPYVSGSSGAVVSSVTYYGNIATTDVTYSARNANGVVVLPQNTVRNRGEGDHANCLGSWWDCSFTFRLQTVVSLSYLGAECGVTVTASATHRAEWTYPTFLRLSGSTWGTAFAANGPASASNGSCATPPPTSPTGGDGSTPPSTGTTESPTYQPAPFVPSGHWECIIYFMGTDYEKEYCTWYPDYDRLPRSSPTFALSASDDAPSRALTSADLPSVFVIVSDQVPASAMAVIERRSQGPFKNVLLVPSSTIRPAVLVAALRALADSRGREGETPAADLTLTLKGGILDQQIPAAARDYAASFTALIANAKRGDAGAYGLRPILELRLGDRK